eukprot:TRINITY_DN1376_c0_g2_i2.p1 TRINITY_DN1376_c0_g2~~TRINITY_DN1376_c0_g2_i2.p1  ORF type:complete len:355 (-),score=33.32 TRINITY_DN1376_c0_g2_i2:289-1353(-)
MSSTPSQPSQGTIRKNNQPVLILAIVFGAVVVILLALLLILVIWFKKKRKEERSRQNSSSNNSVLLSLNQPSQNKDVKPVRKKKKEEFILSSENTLPDKPQATKINASQVHLNKGWWVWSGGKSSAAPSKFVSGSYYTTNDGTQSFRTSYYTDSHERKSSYSPNRGKAADRQGTLRRSYSSSWIPSYKERDTPSSYSPRYRRSKYRRRHSYEDSRSSVPHKGKKKSLKFSRRESIPTESSGFNNYDPNKYYYRGDSSGYNKSSNFKTAVSSEALYEERPHHRSHKSQKRRSMSPERKRMRSTITTTVSSFPERGLISDMSSKSHVGRRNEESFSSVLHVPLTGMVIIMNLKTQH